MWKNAFMCLKEEHVELTRRCLVDVESSGRAGRWIGNWKVTKMLVVEAHEHMPSIQFA